QRTKAWHRGSRLTAKGHNPHRVLEVCGLCGQHVLVEPAEDPSTLCRAARPRWVHAALLVPYQEGWSPPELVWDEEEPVASLRGAAAVVPLEEAGEQTRRRRPRRAAVP
ncbi:MAG TPA: hypothetical protein VK150_06035, partial [Geothrix sp.]|nr:hypothetical protein [Geothrix sp.]